MLAISPWQESVRNVQFHMQPQRFTQSVRKHNLSSVVGNVTSLVITIEVITCTPLPPASTAKRTRVQLVKRNIDSFSYVGLVSLCSTSVNDELYYDCIRINRNTLHFFKYSIRGAEVTAYHIYWYWHVCWLMMPQTMRNTKKALEVIRNRWIITRFVLQAN